MGAPTTSSDLSPGPVLVDSDGYIRQNIFLKGTIGMGDSSDNLTSDTPDKKFVELRCESSATSGDNRLMYLAYELSGAGGGGECLRARTTLSAANGTARGGHVSLEVDDAGYVTGLGAGLDGQLYVKGIVPSGGTYYAGKTEMYFDASASIAAATAHAIHYFAANGDATAAATCLNLFAIDGAAGSGKMISVGTSMGTVTGTLRCRLNGSSTIYLPYYSHEGSA